VSPEKREAVTKKQGNVTMPNPRIQFRIPTELFEQLPSNPNERSHLLKRLLEEHYNPKNPESDLANLKVRVEALERRFGDAIGVRSEFG